MPVTEVIQSKNFVSTGKHLPLLHPGRSGITNLIESLSCQILSVHLMLAVGSNSFQHTQNMFFMLENADLVRKVTPFTTAKM